jgi:hypothetical protein
MNPIHDLRLSRADALAKKHGCDGDGIRPGPSDYLFTVEQIAALIDDASIAKDATISALRKEINDAVREGEREARDAYSQGQSDANEAHRPDY